MSNGSKLPMIFAVGATIGSALVANGCGKGKAGDTMAKDATSTQDGVPQVDPTLCDTTGKNVVTFDLNRDGKPDVWRLYKTVDDGGTKVEYMTCKQVDFDHDGRKDWVVGYGPKGQRLFEKVDMDFDGRFDLSAIYDPKTGKLAQVERDTDFDGKFDLKELYDPNGQLQSVRLDRNGDGEPDEWEQYKDGKLVAILYDDNFDGKVDRRDDSPGSRQKVEMPTLADPTAVSADVKDDKAKDDKVKPDGGSANAAPDSAKKPDKKSGKKSKKKPAAAAPDGN